MYWNITNMVALIFLVIFIVQAIAEKRILLNDPDLLQSQIRGLERKAEDEVSTYSVLIAKFKNLFVNYNDLSTKYTNQSTKYTDLSIKYSDRSIPFTNLSAKYSNLSAKYSTLQMLTKSNGLFTSVSKIWLYFRLVYKRSL